MIQLFALKRCILLQSTELFQGKRSPREFNEFLLKLLNECSTEYRDKLLHALEALGKGFENPYNKELAPDLRQVVRLGKNKKYSGRNRR